MKKILVIEDDENIRENISEILELANYKVFTAAGGIQGVEAAITHQPDLILCDIMMPELDGYGVLNMVHNNPHLSTIPFIFLTAKTTASDFRKGMELGADDYLTKPFTSTDLLNAIDSRLRKAALIKQEISSGFQNTNEPLNTNAGDDTLQHFAEGRNIDKFKKKQLIYTEGNHPLRLFYIVKGKVKIFKTNEEGKELVIDLYKEGDFFGYAALLEETVYKDNAEAMEDCEIALIPKLEFEQLIHSNNEVARKFIKLLVKDITEKEQHLISIAYNSLRKKVADALITVESKYQPNVGVKSGITISRENLAAIAGTATESLIRTLSDFKNEKLIEIKEGCIVILNSNKLRKMLN